MRQYAGGYGFAYLDDQSKVKIAGELPLSGQNIKPRVLPLIESTEIDIVGMPDENITATRLLSPDELFSKIREHLSCYVGWSEIEQQDEKLKIFGHFSRNGRSNLPAF